MATVIKPRRRPAVAGGKNGSNRRDAVEASPGSLESKLAAIGNAVPAGEWEKIPADYFANPDH